MTKLPPCGIIFIDCWQEIAQSKWPQENKDFDFFNNMIKNLEPYHAQNLVFHTGTFGNLPLAHALKSWHDQTNAVDINDLNYFRDHYIKVDVKNWVVVGAHWQRCTHDKILGFKNLYDLKQQYSDLHIFSRPACTANFVMQDSENDNIGNPIVRLCEPNHYDNDSLKWQKHLDLFELV